MIFFSKTRQKKSKKTLTFMRDFSSPSAFSIKKKLGEARRDTHNTGKPLYFIKNRREYREKWGQR